MKTPKNSDKVFGGNSLQAGTYRIKQSLIYDEKATINGEEVTYDCLAVEVLDETGAEVEAVLSLNGCWRPRRGEDNKKYQASGNFFDQILRANHGKSFNATRDWINANLKGKKISVAYTDYPSQSGGWARVPVVNILP
jgi:hypothetical protein